jgi:hypothetical protein
MAGRGMAWLVKAWPGVARQGFCGLRPVAGIRCLERTGDGSRRGTARHGGAGLGWAGQGQYGLRPVAGIRCLERTGDGSGHGEAGPGKAGLGKAGKAWVVTKRLRLVVGHTKGAIRRSGVETVESGRSPGVSQPSVGRYINKEKLVKVSERLTKPPVSRHYQPGATLNFQETIWS